ncbi:MAG: hypothetical protein P8Y60_15240 [Calditrichota bacterium]
MTKGQSLRIPDLRQECGLPAELGAGRQSPYYSFGLIHPWDLSFRMGLLHHPWLVKTISKPAIVKSHVIATKSGSRLCGMAGRRGDLLNVTLKSSIHGSFPHAEIATASMPRAKGTPSEQRQRREFITI